MRGLAAASQETPCENSAADPYIVLLDGPLPRASALLVKLSLAQQQLLLVRLAQTATARWGQLLAGLSPVQADMLICQWEAAMAKERSSPLEPQQASDGDAAGDPDTHRAALLPKNAAKAFPGAQADGSEDNSSGTLRSAVVGPAGDVDSGAGEAGRDPVAPDRPGSMADFFLAVFSCFGDQQMAVQRALMTKRQDVFKLAFDRVVQQLFDPPSI